MSDVIADGELAVRLSQDISGGLGNHPKGSVMRNLSEATFNTLTHTNMATAIPAGSSAEPVDLSSANVVKADPEKPKAVKASPAPAK